MATVPNITSIPAPRVPLIDERTGTISREWYRFLLNLFTLTGSGQNLTSLEDLQVGPPSQGIDNYMVDPSPTGSTQESQIAEIDKRIQALESNNDFATITSELVAIQSEIEAINTVPPLTPTLRKSSYGAFHDTTTQSAAVINTAYAITFNSTDISNGVTIGTPTSRVYVDRKGVYNFQFSAQLDKTSASAKDMYIWADINGTSVPYSATQLTLSGSHSATVAAWNFVLDMKADDYFRLMWSTADVDCKIVSIVAGAPVPGIPSIILTVTDNISATQD